MNTTCYHSVLGVPVWYKTMYLKYIFEVVESRYSEIKAKIRISSIIDSLIRILAIISLRLIYLESI
jgi:hypothetical protein